MRPAWLSKPADTHNRTKYIPNLLLNHPIKAGTSTFILIYIIAILYVRSISYRDPGSLFFRPEEGYKLRYSIQRLAESEELLGLASNTSSLGHDPIDSRDAQLCIGIPSVAREDVRYLRTTVASLLQGLRDHERSSIYLTVLIAHSDPHAHPAYGEPWLNALADKVLLYDLSPTELEHVIEMENRHGGGEEKRLYDYMFLVKACYNTGAPYMALFEDGEFSYISSTRQCDHVECGNTIWRDVR